MGRFATTVEFYARCREPYTLKFFETVARDLNFSGKESLLDVGCGPGLLAIGFSQYVARCTGVDPELAMLDEARKAAANAGAALKLHQSRIEDFSSTEKFELITIGRALHWLDREAAIPSLDRLLAPGGRILICGASTADDQSAWLKLYDQIRQSYATEPIQAHYKIDGTKWFAGSPFGKTTEIRLPEKHRVNIDDLIGRSLSKSNTSPAMLGVRRATFESEIRAALEPLANQEELEEEVVGKATVFERLG